MRIIIAVLILTTSTSVLAQKKASNILKIAYEKQSDEYLKEFFELWRKEVKPIKKKELLKLNDTIQCAYKVFESFYNPTEIGKIGGSEWGDSLYSSVQYYIVQNSVTIKIANFRIIDTFNKKFIIDNNAHETNLSKSIEENKESDRKWIKVPPFESYIGPELEFMNEIVYDTLKDFRPKITVRNKIKYVFLNNDYEKILNSFLEDKHTELGIGSIMNPAKAIEESEQKKKFLKKYIKYFYGHWGGYWQLPTYPLAINIILSKDLKFAFIDFRMIYTGGNALLEFRENKWILIGGRRTWVE